MSSAPHRPPDAGTRLFAAGFAAFMGVALPIALVAASASSDGLFPLGAALAISVVWMAFTFSIAYWSYRKVHAPAAGHLKVSVSADTVKRGDEVEVRLEIADTAQAAELTEIGLVCMEYYDVRRSTGNGTSQQRRTDNDVAHETWLRADTKQRLQSVKVAVPADAPFSFSGSCVKYDWLVTAREPRKMRGDRRVSVPIKVAP